MNNEIPLACNNDTCMKHTECLRFKLYKDGAQQYKSFNGNPRKACGKFIQNKD
ncbi:MAG: hypothetical protein HOF69_03670 [Campylobacteraceae bacterium]|jgi:hypothetical protein|nr:hypothetical protein [Campylobacteraceae bacterium]MBT3882343.1 hypothetical protein [Campylobacteraceae bacterium]MBT4030554.1 hypothetical protein [Campylobacteraceae bacterium]MBT4179007.1 hypothetical protein [Campylobacteraceae bacterium]MBT4572333.1 hypothetical protein [Campylobacteraceae bacterium]